MRLLQYALQLAGGNNNKNTVDQGKASKQVTWHDDDLLGNKAFASANHPNAKKGRGTPWVFLLFLLLLVGVGFVSIWFGDTVSVLERSSLFLLFGGTAGYILHLFNRRLHKVEKHVTGLSETYKQMLAGFARTVEVRDENTRGHCDRVAQNAIVMGRELDFDEQELETLYWCAVLHDLGKIAVPQYILLKPGPLSDEEYDEIKCHPAYGAKLLHSASPEFVEIAKVIRYHHERWDGAGYPEGLKGEDIPLMSRIISVIDVFEALTSDRPYRDPMQALEALELIKNNAGTQFDPRLVNVFEQLYFDDRMQVAPGIMDTQNVVDIKVSEVDNPTIEVSIN